MAEYSLTLSALKYANVTNFSRPFGTKKTTLQNAGSLTTEEFNIANALPFDTQRPLVITETSTVSNIQYNANLVISSAGINITLNTAQYIGAKVSVYAQTAGNVIHDSVTDALLAGERVVYEWNGTGWDCVGGTPLGKLNYTSMCTSALSASKAVSISGFTLKDGVTVEVFFVNGHYVSLSSDAFILNINALGAKKIYACKDGSQILMPNHSIERSESGDSQTHNWYIQPNTTLKLMYLSSLDSNNGGFVIIGNPIVLSSADYVIYADGKIEKPYPTKQTTVANVAIYTTWTWTNDVDDGLLFMWFAFDVQGERTLTINRGNKTLSFVITHGYTNASNYYIQSIPVRKGDILTIPTTTTFNLEAILYY